MNILSYSACDKNLEDKIFYRLMTKKFKLQLIAIPVFKARRTYFKKF